MKEIELSLLSGAEHPEEIQALARKFEETRYIYRVNITYRTWDAAWVDMVHSTIYGDSPTISEIGSTWTPDLIGMNALYPLPVSMASKIGDREGYVPSMWESCFLQNNPQMWSAPWLSATRVVYYRQDILDKAGVNPDTAFSNPSAMLQTMAQLREAGIARPWTTSTTSSLNTLHLALSWIWGAGGNLFSQDGKSLLFTEETVLRSIADFFALGQYMGPDPRGFDYNHAIRRFWGGEAAVTIDGTWMYQTSKNNAHPIVLDNLGVAMTPGPAFMGGSNLAIWNNAKDKIAAQELLYFLIESESVITICNLSGLSPVRLESLHAPEYAARPFGKVMTQAIMTGHSIPNHKFSGLVENKLRYALGTIWETILTQPGVDPYEIVAKTLVALKNRLEISMEESAS